VGPETRSQRLHALGIHLEMKLHTPCGAAEPEGLIGHVIAGYQQISAFREIEGVLVPLENPIAGRKGAEQDVGLTLIGEAHALDAEHRQPCVHSPPHQLSLGQQVGMPIGLVNIHLHRTG